MSWADPVSPAQSGARDEEKVNAVRGAGEGIRAGAGDDPDDPPRATAVEVWKGWWLRV